MKRILLCLGLVALMSFILIGCSNNDQPANATGTPESSIEETLTENTEVVEEPDESIPDEDPLAPLRVDDSFAEACGGIYLVRDGVMYTLNENVPTENSALYGIGWYRSDIYSVLYKFVEDTSLETTDFVSMGDVPLITLEPGDEIRGYKYSSLGLESAERTGYSLPIIEGAYESTRLIIYADLSSFEPIILSESKLKHLEIRDSKNNLIAKEDIHNLNYQETYTVSWYENGTEYQEVQLKADCPYYTSRKRGQVEPWEHEVQGELTKNGYATFDFSGIEPGLYRIDAMFDGYIEIP